MRLRSVQLDLELAREGLLLGWRFGARSVGELARIGVYIQRSVYERGSLLQRPDGFSFRLPNPPLRLGAFGSLRLALDGIPLAPEATWVRTEPAREPRPASTIDREHPLLLLPGVPLEIGARRDPPPSVGSTLSVRIVLGNIAIPPPVWMEFRDRVGPPREP